MSLSFHHCRSVAHVKRGVVEPVRATTFMTAPDCAAAGGCDWSDDWHSALALEAAYEWLAVRIGFWPLFVAVGDSDDARRVSGYQLQWRRAEIAARAGQPPSKVLLSWSDQPARAVFTDYTEWHIVMNSVREIGGDPHRLRVKINKAAEASILRPKWDRDRWLRHARGADVQAAVPQLDLATADELWAPNLRAARMLRDLGFPTDRVWVRRLRQADR